jgi:hypothetical protein
MIDWLIFSLSLKGKNESLQLFCAAFLVFRGCTFIFVGKVDGPKEDEETR